jgi:hypothetical protein
MLRFVCVVVCVALLASSSASVAWAAPARFVALPQGNNTIGVLHDDETYFEFALAGWGPNWQYLGFHGDVREREGASQLDCAATVQASGARLRYEAVTRQSQPRRLQIDLDLRSDRDTDVTCIIASLNLPQRAFAGGSVSIGGETGDVQTCELPLGRRSLGQRVRQIVLSDSAGRDTVLSLDPPCAVSADGELRIVLAEEHLDAEQSRHLTVTVDLPEELVFYGSSDSVPNTPGFEDWYTFQPSEDYDRPSEIGMADWLDAPAGRHGRIARVGDELVYNGQPIKLWGLNVCYSSCAPDKTLADRRAQCYAKYGINTVRLHKYADGTGWAGIQSE